MQFAVSISDIPVTLNQGQGHHTCNDSVDPTQGYSHAKFDRSCFNGVREKGNVKVCLGVVVVVVVLFGFFICVFFFLFLGG